MYQRILIATDGSDLSEKATAGAIALAASLDANIVAYTAVARYPSVYFEGSMVLTAAEVGRIEKLLHQKGQELVAAIQEQAKRQGVICKTVTTAVSGSVSESIIAAARKHRCDLIVMASHGRKGIGRMLLGSETLDVLTHSRIPVLVLR